MVRRRARVRGTVQGVGFRPFVYRRAVELGLSGWVANDGEGVILEVEGPEDAVRSLLCALSDEAPPLAVVQDVSAEQIPARGGTRFEISTTRTAGAVDVPVSADVAPCENCLAELRDPGDRRSGYPFINCTDCGPRYTIVHAVPYDRAATTMARFGLCSLCQREYEDPGDRRFHAEPNACPQCGPTLRWESRDATEEGPPSIASAARCLTSGGIVAVKGVGGYHLACDAADEDAVTTLRKRKGRDDKPFAVMVADLQDAERLCRLSPTARVVLTSPRRPIVLAPRREVCPLAEDVAPHLGELGVLLPSSPLHVLLMTAVDRPLVMTSGNVSDEPVVHTDEDARSRLWPLVDGLLTHDREIRVRVDDSVLRTGLDGTPRMIRRARGWVPQPLRLPIATPAPVLGVGAQLKSTVSVARGNAVVASQHLGDLDHWPAYASFVDAIEHLTRLGGAPPTVVAHDLHPDYRSTAWAQDCGLALEAVQHHHAHIAACLVEHGVSTPVLGLAFDGVGLGTDGTLWGGEFLLADLTGFTRVGHLAGVPLPGGDAAVREPWRAAVSWIERSLGEEHVERLGPLLDPRWRAVQSVVRSGTAPTTSSVGRLFDAVAAVLAVRRAVSYEGQAAIELEALARSADLDRAPVYDTYVAGDVLDPTPMLSALVDDAAHGATPATCAAGFHLGLARGAARLAIDLADRHGTDSVALTGGVFQNALFAHLMVKRLRAAGLRVLQHQHLPPNDGSISVGQAAVAAARLAR